MSADSLPSISDLLDHWSGLPLPFPPILSYLGGDSVRLALAQLTGYATWTTPRFDIGIAPVPLSFGWAAFAFRSIVAVFLYERLIPSSGKKAIVIDCTDFQILDNESWVVEQLLRAFKGKHKLVGTGTAMCIGQFELEPFDEGEQPQHARDRVWWAGWTIIAVQLAIATVPWALHGNRSVLMFVVAGSAMTLLISALPQWRQEKWAGCLSNGPSCRILTGNCGHHVMIFKGYHNSYDLDALATSQPQNFSRSPLVMCIAAPLCACLLVSTVVVMSGSWFLAGIGGLGTLYSAYAARMQRTTEDSGLKIRQFQNKPTGVVILEDGISQTEYLKKREQLIPEAVSTIDRILFAAQRCPEVVSLSELAFPLDLMGKLG